MMNKPRIKILQYMHGTLEYFPWSEWINRRYCERHGYEYVLRRGEPRRDRHICWHKVPLILDELRDCDYLLFLDADAVFYSHELTLENELIPELQGKSILTAQDCGDESSRWHPGLPNSGVILIKNEERVRQILVEWDSVSEMDEETQWHWPPEQLALWKHILPKFKEDFRIVSDYYIVQGRLGHFIRHFCICPDPVRVNAMKAIYNRLASPHYWDAASVKPVIKVVQYHWGEQNHSYQVSRRINEVYCRRHGYEYVVKTFIPRDDRSPHWAKIPAMREELHDCDFLLYLDADAFFYSHELMIEEELLPFLEDKQIMMSADLASENIRHQPNKPNGGVVLVRNSEKSAEFLQRWDESSERPGMEEFRFNLYHDQEACFRTVWQECADDVQLLKDYYLMNGFCGVFIRHLMGMQDERRLGILKQFVEKRDRTLPITDVPAVRLSQPFTREYPDFKVV
jgi:hypothetical protein